MIWFRAALASLVSAILAAEGGVAVAAGHDAWVRQLGATSFQSRIEAERLILEAGTASIPALIQGEESRNAEVRRRSTRLLEHLRMTAFSERQAEILSNPWIAPSEVTPGWEAFQELVGDGEPARRLYVAMIREESRLLLALIHSPDTWTQTFERRCDELRTSLEYRTQVQSVSPITAAAVIFLGMHPDCHPSSVAVGTVTALINDSQFLNAVRQSPFGGVLKDLVRQWIRRDVSGSASQRLSLAVRFDVDDAMAAARSVIDARGLDNGSMSLLQNSIVYLAKHGRLDAVEELEALLNDEKPLARQRTGSNGSRIDLQVRDVALLGLLLATRQNPQEYGFQNVRADIQTHLYLAGASLPDPETRLAAIERWRSWRKKYLPRLGAPVDASEGQLL